MVADLETAIRIEAAAPDSHFRLLPCPCCHSDNVAYVQYMTGIQEPWKVSCFDCGYTVDQQKIFKHGAQIVWNQNVRGETYDGNDQQRTAQPMQRVPGQVSCLF
jgi:hypothetical protein